MCDKANSKDQSFGSILWEYVTMGCGGEYDTCGSGNDDTDIAEYGHERTLHSLRRQEQEPIVVRVARSGRVMSGKEDKDDSVDSNYYESYDSNKITNYTTLLKNTRRIKNHVYASIIVPIMRTM